MELLGGFLAAKFASFLLKELDLNLKKVVLHMDAKAVLHLIKNGVNEKSRFVQNRLKVILGSNIQEFRYIPSELNPADIASRSMEITQLRQCDLW